MDYKGIHAFKSCFSEISEKTTTFISRKYFFLFHPRTGHEGTEDV
jgi:hypothetical protein